MALRPEVYFKVVRTVRTLQADMVDVTIKDFASDRLNEGIDKWLEKQDEHKRD